MSHPGVRPRPPRPAPPRTLWEEGRRPGGQVAALTLLASLAVAWGNLALTGRLTLFFDLTFVVLCLMAALAVRPRDFFVVGVLPPVALLITIAVLATRARPSVADEGDSLVQAVVSGLAHHAGALVAGYALALGILALRQVALRNAGRLRNAA